MEPLSTTSKYLIAIIILMAIAIVYMWYQLKKSKELQDTLADTAFTAMNAANDLRTKV